MYIIVFTLDNITALNCAKFAIAFLSEHLLDLSKPNSVPYF